MLLQSIAQGESCLDTIDQTEVQSMDIDVNALSGTRSCGFNISLVCTDDSTVLKWVQQTSRVGPASRSISLTSMLKPAVPSGAKP